MGQVNSSAQVRLLGLAMRSRPVEGHQPRRAKKLMYMRLEWKEVQTFILDLRGSAGLDQSLGLSRARWLGWGCEARGVAWWGVRVKVSQRFVGLSNRWNTIEYQKALHTAANQRTVSYALGLACSQSFRSMPMYGSCQKSAQRRAARLGLHSEEVRRFSARRVCAVDAVVIEAWSTTQLQARHGTHSSAWMIRAAAERIRRRRHAGRGSAP